MARYGNNIKIAKEKRIEQVNYLLENMKEPDIRFKQEFDENELNTAKITLRILNTLYHGGANQTTADSVNSWYSLATFMNAIQEYFPKNLQVKYRLWSPYSFIGDTISEEMSEKMEELEDWFLKMKGKILDVITGNYFIDGKMQQLEILKRRFKEHYSERTEQNINADINDDRDIKIEILEA